MTENFFPRGYFFSMPKLCPPHKVYSMKAAMFTLAFHLLYFSSGLFFQIFYYLFGIPEFCIFHHILKNLVYRRSVLLFGPHYIILAMVRYCLQDHILRSTQYPNSLNIKQHVSYNLDVVD